MKEKSGWFRRIFLIVLGIVIVLNLAGIIIEGLFTFGVLQTDLVNIRTYSAPSLIFSLAFLVIAIILWIRYLRKDKRLLIWWHALAAIAALSIAYKVIKPTLLVALLTPFVYFPIFGAIIALIWYFGFWKLKKEYN